MLCKQCGSRGHEQLTVLRSVRVGTAKDPSALNPMKNVAPHPAVLVCTKATARSILDFLTAGVNEHRLKLEASAAKEDSRRPGGTEGPFAMTTPGVTAEQQRLSQVGLLAAMTADAGARAGLLAPSNRAHFDRAMDFSKRAGIDPRDAHIAVSADADLQSSDEEDGGPRRSPAPFKKFAKASAVSFFFLGAGVSESELLSLRFDLRILLTTAYSLTLFFF